MILYHFTARFLTADRKSFEIPPEGLLPCGESQPFECVWLTTDREPGGRDPNRNCLRIAVRIPLNDARLLHYPKWALKDLDPGAVDRMAAKYGRDWLSRTKPWYMYFGAILPERLSKIDFLEGQWPWWLTDPALRVSGIG